jgi:protein SCO1/2
MRRPPSPRAAPPPVAGSSLPSPRGLRGEAALALAGLCALLAVTAGWWALALWPVTDAPQWLERTRLACFGMADSALPDAGGWVGLIGAPAGMLAVMLAGWGDGVRQLLRRARRSSWLAGTLGSLALSALFLVAAAALRVQQVRAGQFDPNAAGAELPPTSYPRQDRPAPSLALTAQDGRDFDLQQLRGLPVLVTFAYAHCQTVCPVVVKQTLAAQATLSSHGLRTAVVILTLDPRRDPPSRLRAMAATWALPERGAWILSGAAPTVEAALDAWQVPRDRNEATGEVTHPALVYVVDAHGRIAFAANGGADALVTLVRRL